MSDKDIIDMKEENGQWSAYVSDFSPEKLWGKIKGHAKKVGCEGIRINAAQDENGDLRRARLFHLAH